MSYTEKYIRENQVFPHTLEQHVIVPKEYEDYNGWRIHTYHYSVKVPIGNRSNPTAVIYDDKTMHGAQAYKINKEGAALHYGEPVTLNTPSIHHEFSSITDNPEEVMKQLKTKLDSLTNIKYDKLYSLDKDGKVRTEEDGATVDSARAGRT